jgi:hypothetical protein
VVHYILQVTLLWLENVFRFNRTKVTQCCVFAVNKKGDCYCDKIVLVCELALVLFLSPCARGVFGNSSPDGTRRAAASRSAGLSMAWLRSWWTRGPISALGHLTPCGRITQIAVSSSKLDPIARLVLISINFCARTRRRLAKLPNYASILPTRDANGHTQKHSSQKITHALENQLARSLALSRPAKRPGAHNLSLQREYSECDA